MPRHHRGGDGPRAAGVSDVCAGADRAGPRADGQKRAAELLPPGGPIGFDGRQYNGGRGAASADPLGTACDVSAVQVFVRDASSFDGGDSPATDGASLEALPDIELGDAAPRNCSWCVPKCTTTTWRLCRTSPSWAISCTMWYSKDKRSCATSSDAAEGIAMRIGPMRLRIADRGLQIEPSQGTIQSTISNQQSAITRRGVVAVEFAIVAPILVAIFRFDSTWAARLRCRTCSRSPPAREPGSLRWTATACSLRTKVQTTSWSAT